MKVGAERQLSASALGKQLAELRSAPAVSRRSLHTCHPKQSEGSLQRLADNTEILRSAQDDSYKGSGRQLISRHDACRLDVVKLRKVCVQIDIAPVRDLVLARAVALRRAFAVSAIKFVHDVHALN